MSGIVVLNGIIVKVCDFHSKNASHILLMKLGHHILYCGYFQLYLSKVENDN